MPIDEGDPEAIRAQGIEGPDLTDGIPCLAQAPALFGQAPNDRVPISLQAR